MNRSSSRGEMHVCLAHLTARPQPEPQRTLAEPGPSALKSNTRRREAGSTANGHECAKTTDSRDKKKPMTDIVNPYLMSVSSTLPVEKKKKNWSESCNCIMFNIHGWVWRAVPTLPLQPLSNENHTIGVGSSPPIKTKDTRTFQRLQQRSIHLMGRKTCWN